MAAVKKTSGVDWRHPCGPGSSLSELDNYSAVSVSWVGARAYCQWVGRWLPTEAEWEKAARDPASQKYPWGDSPPNRNLLNFDLPEGQSEQVGSYPEGASTFSFLDKAGYVNEWVADYFTEDYYHSAPRENPTGPNSGKGRGMQGGNYLWGAKYVRSAHRGRGYQDKCYWATSFRCAQDVQDWRASENLLKKAPASYAANGEASEEINPLNESHGLRVVHYNQGGIYNVSSI